MISIRLDYRILALAIAAAVVCSGIGQAAETVWTYETPGGTIDASPAVADLDGDGTAELVVVTTAGHVAALDAAGQERWTWTTRGPLTIAPTVADVMGGPGLEVLVLSMSGMLHCVDGASGRPNWSVDVAGPIEWGLTTVLAADLDGNGARELIVGDRAGRVVCVNGDGGTVWSYDGNHGMTLSPTAADLDGDGALEVLIGGTQVPLVCLNAAGREQWRLDRPGRGASPVAADLDGDGRPEILAGADGELLAVNGDGSVRWAVPMRREMDSAITVADADNDGTPEVYAVDLDGYVLCAGADGTVRWTADVVERVRRSPAVADVDGDGVTEILVAGYSGAIYVYVPEGYEKARVPMGGNTNATPTVINDGSRLVVAVPTSAGQMPAFAWPSSTADAPVQWGQYRFDGARSALPRAADSGPKAEIAAVDFGNFYVGSNQFRAEIVNPTGEPVTIDLEIVRGTGGRSESRLVSDTPRPTAALSYVLNGQAAENLVLTCTVRDAEGTVVARRSERAYVVPFVKEIADLDAAVQRVQDGLAALPDASGLQERAFFIQSRIPRYREEAQVAGVSDESVRRHLHEALAADIAEIERMGGLVEAAGAATAAAGSPVVLVPANPWAPFGGMDEALEGRLAQGPVEAEGFFKEIESAALNVFNFAAPSRTFRVTLDAFTPAAGGDAVPAKDVATLREAVAVPTDMLDMSEDALPKLNEGQLLRVDGWAARQLWVTLDTGTLAPGTWTSAIRLRSLDVKPIEAVAELKVTVWDVEQPAEYALDLCTWGYVHTSILKDQPEAALRDKVAHGNNVYVGLFYPEAEYDADGNLVGAIDFTAHDAFVKAHAPHGQILFFNYQRALRGPGGHDSEAYGKAHVTWLRKWVAHLKEMGVGYDKFALYPVDEPGLSEGLVDIYLRMGKLAREADPNIRLYTDPVARITMAELEAMAPYVDIWCPNRVGFLLHENNDMLAFMQSTGATMWTYECEGFAKHQSPLGYYRGLAWLAWHHDLTGIGFWSYCTSQDDPWFAPATRNDYLLIYQGDGVVPSKRWEAVRDGMEDYTLLRLLETRANAAEQAGRAAEAIAQARELLGPGATAVAQFCGLDEHGTRPGDAGFGAVRQLADSRWHTVQETRRGLAEALEALAP